MEDKFYFETLEALLDLGYSPEEAKERAKQETERIFSTIED